MSFVLEDSKTRSSERPYPSLLLGFDEFVTDIDIPRYLRKNDATLKFPVKLLLLIEQAEREVTDCLRWTPDGKGVILRTTSSELQDKILPLASSCGGKLLSFTRKLYRWGFRQARSSYAKEKIFCHPLFQRDDKTLMVGMKSTTAEGTKKALVAKNLMAFPEARLPKQLEAPYPSAKMDHNRPVHDCPYFATNSAMPITTHSLLQESMMLIPGGAMWSPAASYGMDYGHPSLRLPPPGIHHLVSSTIHGAMSEMDAGKLLSSLNYLQPAPPPSMQSVNTMPMLQPRRFNRPTLLGGNTYSSQYEAAYYMSNLLDIARK